MDLEVQRFKFEISTEEEVISQHSAHLRVLALGLSRLRISAFEKPPRPRSRGPSKKLHTLRTTTCGCVYGAKSRRGAGSGPYYSAFVYVVAFRLIADGAGFTRTRRSCSVACSSCLTPSRTTARIAKAARERWARYSAADQATLASRVTLARVNVGLPLVWRGCTEAPLTLAQRV